MSYKKMFRSSDGRIYYPLTPCVWTSKPTRRQIMDLTISCGGGMGGSKWHEYVFDNQVYNGLHGYQNINGDTIILNSAYIVKAEYTLLVKVSYKHDNSNYPATRGTEQQLLVLSDSQVIKLIKEYKRLEEV